MKKLLTLISILLLVACKPESKQLNNDSSQIVDTLKYEKLLNILSQKDDVVYVVNFWATWCKPCIEELPEFMEVNKEFNLNKNYKMILVSLDKASEFETSVKPFIKKNNIITDVYLLNDTKRANHWIPIFDKDWDGAIPTTFIYKNGEKLKFIDKQINKKELVKTLKNYL